MVTLFFEPSQIGLGRNARIHHHRSPKGGRQDAEHTLQGLGLTGVAGKDSAPAHKAAAVEHHRQRDQGAVAALFFATPSYRFGYACCDTLEVGIGQVVQSDSLNETKH